MEHRLLIVDDEPIILSGIKSLIDWKKFGITIAGTARNGEDAYAFISKHHPDIVITDIKMPIMDGIALLKKCNDEYPDIVFIILSSLEEFRLAKEAMSYRAIDYLLKIELDERNMEQCIEKALLESERRHIGSLPYSIAESGESKLERYMSNFFKFRKISVDFQQSFASSGFSDNYAIISILMPKSDIDNPDEFEKNMAVRMAWESEIAEKVISSYFPNHYSISPISSKDIQLSFMLAGFSVTSWNRNIQVIREKIENASRKVLNNEVFIVDSGVHHGTIDLYKSRDAIEYALCRFYLEKDDANPLQLSLDYTLTKIEKAISTKDSQAISVVMSLIKDRMAGTDHTRNQAIFFLEAMEYAIRSGFSGTDMESEGQRITSQLVFRVPYVSRRNEVIQIMENVEKDLIELLRCQGSHNEIVGKAKLFILSNLERPLSLAEIADNACVSPGYLSALFKKTTGISLVDYMNNCKIEKAKDMIANGYRRIDDMARSLGFDNIYYFSKVFKKITGLPPTEYIRKIEFK